VRRTRKARRSGAGVAEGVSGEEVTNNKDAADAEMLIKEKGKNKDQSQR